MINKYNELILSEDGLFESSFNGSHKEFDFITPKCDFCGHRITLGRSILNKSLNKEMIVGSDCFCNLLGLDKLKQKIIKREDLLIKNKKKYENITSYLKKKYNAKPWWEMRAILDTKRIDLISCTYELNDKDEVRFKFTDVDNNSSFISWRSRQDDYLCCGIECKEQEIVNEILRKILTTTSINNYWFDKYEELTGIKVLDEK